MQSNQIGEWFPQVSSLFFVLNLGPGRKNKFK